MADLTARPEVATESTSVVSMPKISFNVKKQVQSKVVRDGRADAVEVGSDTEDSGHVTHFENGLVNGETKPKTKDLVIERKSNPNDWRIRRLQKLKDEGHATDQQLATLTILLEASGQLVAPTQEGKATEEAMVTTLVQDEEPDDVEPDYDKVGYSQFGHAFMRGLGWNPGEGLGKTNKRVVPLTVYEKAKTFKLAADKTTRPNQSKDDKEPPPPMEEGVAVFVEGGANKGRYGRLKFLDDITKRASVRLTTGQEVEITANLLTAVTEKEFTNAGKTVNKESYKKAEGQNRKENDRREVRHKSERYKPDKKRTKEERPRKYDNGSDDDIMVIEPGTSDLWVAPNLVVRVVDKRYRHGDYFKEKMSVVDVASKEHVELKDDRGKLHTLSQHQLETVIPKDLDKKVMIVAGPHKGRAGRVAEKDKHRELIWVTVTGCADSIKAPFDDVCEFRGNLEELEY